MTKTGRKRNTEMQAVPLEEQRRFKLFAWDGAGFLNTPNAQRVQDAYKRIVKRMEAQQGCLSTEDLNTMRDGVNRGVGIALTANREIEWAPPGAPRPTLVKKKIQEESPMPAPTPPTPSAAQSAPATPAMPGYPVNQSGIIRRHGLTPARAKNLFKAPGFPLPIPTEKKFPEWDSVEVDAFIAAHPEALEEVKTSRRRGPRMTKLEALEARLQELEDRVALIEAGLNDAGVAGAGAH